MKVQTLMKTTTTRTSLLSLAALAPLAAVAVANAGLAFSFADPTPGKQLHNVQDNHAGAGTGLMTYDQDAAITFLVDGSTEANPFTTSWTNARMEMNMTVFTGSTSAGVFSAPVSGFFRIYDANTGATIVRGDATGGAFLRFAGTSTILLSSDSGFAYTFGQALIDALAFYGNAGSSPFDPQEGSFSLTDAVAVNGGDIIGEGGVVQSFDANASFSGNTETIPAPGALALLSVAGLVSARRRRA